MPRNNFFHKIGLLKQGFSDQGFYVKRLLDFNVKIYLKNLNKFSYEELHDTGARRALRLFHLAAKRAPAYKDFLNKNRINPERIKRAGDLNFIPPINKDNYITNYPFQSQLIDGEYRNISLFSVSSGSSGKPTFWPRSTYLEYETAILHEVFLETFFQISKLRTLAIVAYSMGLYVAGTFTVQSLQHLSRKGYPIYVLSPGINISEIIDVLVSWNQQIDQVIIFGYPPFVKDIIDQALKLNDRVFKKKVGFIFGAESFSEEWRENILSRVGIQNETDIIMSSMNTYGSADAAILGHETPLSIAFRRLINKQQKNESLFGQKDLPTIVQYNPLMKYFQAEGEKLIFTANAGVPLIRYDIGDLGGIIPQEKYRDTDIDQEHGVWKRLPMLYLRGKSTNVATIYGVKIFPENIKTALEDVEIEKLVSGKFVLETKYDLDNNQYLQINIETSDETIITQDNKNIIISLIYSKLLQSNLEFRQLESKIGKRALPKVSFFQRGYFALQKSKHKWIN
ncbi:MAG: phenylacetate--CoA ligase family protein [Candidatus Kerfeldbacteria bacterium]|nr:phenylacetate--CoA ligase family protein [Candidatus Kerfeldbacteria bacterium]